MCIADKFQSKGMVRSKQEKIQVLGAIIFHLCKNLPSFGEKKHIKFFYYCLTVLIYVQ